MEVIGSILLGAALVAWAVVWVWTLYDAGPLLGRGVEVRRGEQVDLVPGDPGPSILRDPRLPRLGAPQASDRCWQVEPRSFKRALYFEPCPCRGGSETRPPSSSGLGSRPFKAETRVRIPLGALHGNRIAWACGAVWSARDPVKVEVGGSNPLRPASGAARRFAEGLMQGEVAQLAEHSAENRGVGGSNPSLATVRAQGPGYDPSRSPWL